MITRRSFTTAQQKAQAPRKLTIAVVDDTENFTTIVTRNVANLIKSEAPIYGEGSLRDGAVAGSYVFTSDLFEITILPYYYGKDIVDAFKAGQHMDMIVTDMQMFRYIEDPDKAKFFTPVPVPGDFNLPPLNFLSENDLPRPAKPIKQEEMEIFDGDQVIREITSLCTAQNKPYFVGMSGTDDSKAAFLKAGAQVFIPKGMRMNLEVPPAVHDLFKAHFKLTPQPAAMTANTGDEGPHLTDYPKPSPF